MSDTDTKAAKISPTWGYHPIHEPKIFELLEGEVLPQGWFNHPDKAKEAAQTATQPPQAQTQAQKPAVNESQGEEAAKAE